VLYSPRVMDTYLDTWPVGPGPSHDVICAGGRRIGFDAGEKARVVERPLPIGQD
jgi:hypothetical protein